MGHAVASRRTCGPVATIVESDRETFTGGRQSMRYYSTAADTIKGIEDRHVVDEESLARLSIASRSKSYYYVLAIGL
jgi:hypothetical protein